MDYSSQTPTPPLSSSTGLAALRTNSPARETQTAIFRERAYARHQARSRICPADSTRPSTARDRCASRTKHRNKRAVAHQIARKDLDAHRLTQNCDAKRIESAVLANAHSVLTFANSCGQKCQGACKSHNAVPILEDSTIRQHYTNSCMRSRLRAYNSSKI